MTSGSGTQRIDPDAQQRSNPAHLAAAASPVALRRALALTAVGSFALLCTRAAMAVDPSASSLPRNVFVRVDAGAALVVGAVAVAAIERRRADGRTRALVLDLARLWVLWFLVVAVNSVLVHRATMSDALSTAFTFRAHDSAQLGLGVGRVILAVAIALVLASLVVAFEAHGRRVIWLVGVLAAVGWGARIAEAEMSSGFARSLLSLGAFADYIAAGFAVSSISRALLRNGPRPMSRFAVVAAGLLVVLGLGAAVFLVGPLAPDGAGVFDHGLWRAVCGTSVVAGVLIGSLARPALMSSTGVLIERSLAVAAPGLLLGHEGMFVAVVRRYPERLHEDARGVWLAANASPAIVWAVIFAGSFGVLVSWMVIAMHHRRTVRSLLPMPLTVAALASFGLLVRLVTLFNVAPERTDGGDPRFYHVTANLLAHARSFPEPLNWLNDETMRPTALHGPLYPIVLSVSSRFGGTQYIDHKLLSLLIGAGIVLVVILLAREVAGSGVALVAGFLAAVYPNLWILDEILFPEPLAALLTTLAVLFAYRWRASPSWRASAVLGGTIALGALARGEGILLLGLLVLPCVVLPKSLSLGTRVKHLVMVGLVFGLVISPWSLRNVRVFVNVVPLSTNSNELLVYANCDTVYSGGLLGYWDFYCQERIRSAQGEFPGDESQTSLRWRDAGLDYAGDHAAELPKVLAARALRQWEFFRPGQNLALGEDEGRHRASATVALAMYYPMLALGIVGAFVHRRARRWLLPLIVPFLGVTVVALYAYGNARFRAPAEPALCILAAIGLAAVVTRVRGGDSSA